ncbi:laccase [Stygiomarasmius scandens]|uniref:Laccase n=1 Tax=Marasmiellus scandens TaxID=2682957 RepID=A0ABR1JYD7_9AGAR
MMILSASYLLLALVFPTFTFAADVNYVFNIDNSIVAPDGFERAGVIVNDLVPGTLIQASKNDVLHIQTNNNLTDPTMRQVFS